ncbi:ubiquitin-like with PHD and RING finger domains 2 [Massospora cicadina]|nr:ubiquitin-like with PHD and RING finger domains 2 [Massospora cicadina]
MYGFPSRKSLFVSLYRLQLCANYLHRPSMAGIHGAGEYPAYSIVLQGGYQSDEDHGMDFYYTGAGGRDDKGVHIKDQELGRSNLSLAASCDANLNPNGAEALDWTKSAPIRVIRGHLLKKHSPQYAPNALRYDGIYKLVRYWKEKIPEGFTIWRYHLRRDDDEPAPWTPEGKQYIIDNNIVFTDSEPLRRLRRTMPNSPYSTMRAPHSPLIVLEPFEPFAQAEFEPQDQACIDTHLCDTPLNVNFSPQRKHKMQDEVVTQETVVQLSEGGEEPELSNEGVAQFLERVRNSFTCAVCFDLVESTAPYTTACGHNFCRPCFRASVRQNQGLCPKCKNHIPEDLLDEDNVPIAISSSSQALFNPALSEILIALKPGLDYYSATK